MVIGFPTDAKLWPKLFTRLKLTRVRAQHVLIKLPNGFIPESVHNFCTNLLIPTLPENFEQASTSV